MIRARPAPNDGNAGFLRDEAALVVVFVGDEDDHSPDSVDTYVRFLQSKKGEFQPQRMTIYAIAPTAAACSTAGGAGTRYAEAATRTGGEVVSVCAAGLRPLAPQRGDQGLLSAGPLPAERAAGSWLGGRASERLARHHGWSYDGATNSVVFSPGPAPGAKVEIAYRRACQ